MVEKRFGKTRFDKTAEFESVAMPHTRGLLRVARRLASDEAAAEDLVQDTLLLAWRGFHQFEAGTNARAWLFRILFNAHRAKGRKLGSSPITVPLLFENRFASSEPGPERSLEVAQALNQLAHEHQTVLVLGVVEGFTCQEIAEILALPMGTVMSRLSRARRALRSRLEPAAHKVKCAKEEA
jgi:RNA polymerase sigma-70 factor (ECF subfamily)